MTTDAERTELIAEAKAILDREPSYNTQANIESARNLLADALAASTATPEPESAPWAKHHKPCTLAFPESYDEDGESVYACHCKVNRDIALAWLAAEQPVVEPESTAPEQQAQRVRDLEAERDEFKKRWESAMVHWQREVTDLRAIFEGSTTDDH